MNRSSFSDDESLARETIWLDPLIILGEGETVYPIVFLGDYLHVDDRKTINAVPPGPVYFDCDQSHPVAGMLTFVNFKIKVQLRGSKWRLGCANHSVRTSYVWVGQCQQCKTIYWDAIGVGEEK